MSYGERAARVFSPPLSPLPPAVPPAVQALITPFLPHARSQAEGTSGTARTR